MQLSDQQLDCLADCLGHLIFLARARRQQNQATTAAVALLDADDAEFNKPFSEACELDAALLDLPSAKPKAEEAEVTL